ncbi:MAG: glycosyltransferase family 2 protein [Candidatus Falkowbacteria bacterium]|nr:glycosyltransferase family 2 protein [Candidatus Falkowbacteria bacterium]
MKKVGIVLINYHDYAQKFLIPCRDALRSQDYPKELVNIYLIDNASSEDSCNFLKNTYSEAMVLPRIDGNYCAASNLGFKQADRDGCEYLVALNMDTEVQPGWLEKLVEALEKNPDAAIAQSLIYLAPKTEAEKLTPRLNTAGNVINFLFFGFTSFYGQSFLRSGISKDSYPEISYPSGCSFIIRREVFEEIGGYNEDYYMYHDDLSLGLKAHLLGWKIILAPLSTVFHKYQFGRNKRNFYYLERNRHLVYRAFYSRRARMVLFPAFWLMDFGLLLFSIPGGWFEVKWKLYRELASKNFAKQIQRERDNFLKVAKVKQKIIAKNFSGQVQFAEIDNFVLKYLVNPAFNAYWKIVKKII